MSTTKVNLWYAKKDTVAARYYCRHNRPNPEPADFIWVPLSIIEHTSKNVGGHHVLTLPNWFIEKEGL